MGFGTSCWLNSLNKNITIRMSKNNMGIDTGV